MPTSTAFDITRSQKFLARRAYGIPGQGCTGCIDLNFCQRSTSDAFQEPFGRAYCNTPLQWLLEVQRYQSSLTSLKSWTRKARYTT